jgi:hypothetical protein
VRARLPSLGPLEYAALALFFVVALYTGWVAWDFHDSSADDGTASAPRSSSPTPSVDVAAPEAPATPPPLGPFSDAASTASTILVIGDSTGAGQGAWVDLVAQDLGNQSRVALHEWDETSSQFAEQPTSYGDLGRRVDLWNLSVKGIDRDYGDFLDTVPAPDAVLVDIGHDRGPRALTRAATATLDALGARWGDVPTAFVLQNPSVLDERSQQRRGVHKLTRLAGEYAEPVIDVYTAFEQDTSGETLVADDSRPTDAGSRLWADVVDDALGVTTSR